MRVKRAVVIGEHNHIAGCLFYPAVARLRNIALWQGVADEGRRSVMRHKRLDHVAGVVTGAIINDQHLKRVRGVVNLSQRFQRSRQ